VHRRHLVATALAIVTFLAPANRAHAGGVTLCTFAAGTASVTLSGGVSATLSRSGTAITLNGTACDTATVLNTDLVAVTSPDSFGLLTFGLSAGPFAPGATDEGDGSSEIEITVSSPSQPSDVSVIGSAMADHITADGLANTLNLNADEAVDDVDVTMTDASDIAMIDTHEGDDVIETAHTDGHLIGGDGEDLFRSTDDGSVQIDGVAGDDTVSYATNTGAIRLLGDETNVTIGDPGGPFQQLSSIRTVRTTQLDDEITIGSGLHIHALGGADRANVVDGRRLAVSGGPGHDVLTFLQSTSIVVVVEHGLGRGGGTHAHFGSVERIVGTEADDLFVAGGHDYAMDGGGGVDTYSMENLPRGVRVDLQTGQVSDGDRLDAFEAVIGSPSADRILGSSLMNVLAGRGGDDVIRGLAAGDLLFGGNGDDQLDGGPGNDECHGGAGTDTLVSC
jgi:Ca2+-binding RTX toxin-like protein